MTVARALPAELAPRFRAAPRAVARTESASVEVVVAQSFLVRLRGLAGLRPDEVVPLLFPRCRSLHTFRMRSPIDVVWLEFGDEAVGGIRAIAGSVDPGRLVHAPRGAARGRCAALELPAGDADTFGLRPGTLVHLSA